MTKKRFKSLHLGSWKLQSFTLSDSFWLLPCVVAGLWDPFNEPPEGISHKAWNPQLPHLRWWVRHWLLQETGNVSRPSECVAQSCHMTHHSFFPEHLKNFPKTSGKNLPFELGRLHLFAVQIWLLSKSNCKKWMFEWLRGLVWAAARKLEISSLSRVFQRTSRFPRPNTWATSRTTREPH